MKIKRDENLGENGAALLRQAGHDVATIPGQDLCSAAAQTVIEKMFGRERPEAVMSVEEWARAKEAKRAARKEARRRARAAGDEHPLGGA